MSESTAPSIVDLLDGKKLSDGEVRRLIGWQGLLLVDLLRRRCVTVRYAEQMLFNLEVAQRIEQRRLKDCLEVIDWGMQLEDWEAHTPDQVPEALSTIARLARGLLMSEHKPQHKKLKPKTSSKYPSAARRQVV